MGWAKKPNSGGGGGDYELIPAGNHVARLNCLFHCGIHTDTFGSKSSDKEKIVVVVQLAKKGPSGNCYVIAERYTFSLHEDAHFRKLIESALGFTLGEDVDFDPRDLVGKLFLANVVHDKKGEKTYHRLASLTPLPDGMRTPPDAHWTYPTICWSVDDGTPFPKEHDDWLPWIYGQQIREFAGMGRKSPAGNGNGPTPPGAYSAPGPNPNHVAQAAAFNEFAEAPPWA